jgi:uncharacterized cysteine cluster protein YcgN (CxxCxxCC family)
MWDHTRNQWDRQALLILEAFEMYDTSLCGGCAQSSIHALDVANTREYTADTVNCLGCNVRETWIENNSDTRIKGQKVYVVNPMGKVVTENG